MYRVSNAWHMVHEILAKTYIMFFFPILSLICIQIPDGIHDSHCRTIVEKKNNKGRQLLSKTKFSIKKKYAPITKTNDYMTRLSNTHKALANSQFKNEISLAYLHNVSRKRICIYLPKYNIFFWQWPTPYGCITTASKQGRWMCTALMKVIATGLTLGTAFLFACVLAYKYNQNIKCNSHSHNLQHAVASTRY